MGPPGDVMGITLIIPPFFGIPAPGVVDADPVVAEVGEYKVGTGTVDADVDGAEVEVDVWDVVAAEVGVWVWDGGEDVVVAALEQPPKTKKMTRIIINDNQYNLFIGLPSFNMIYQ